MNMNDTCYVLTAAAKEIKLTAQTALYLHPLLTEQFLRTTDVRMCYTSDLKLAM
jgi:hypothetical protein